MTELIELLARAHRARLAFSRKGDRLVIRGPREHEPLVRALLARKPEVLGLIAICNGRVGHLDWRREPLLNQLQPCALCGRLARLVEPYDRRPCHKTCAEAAIRWGIVPASVRMPNPVA